MKNKHLPISELHLLFCWSPFKGNFTKKTDNLSKSSLSPKQHTSNKFMCISVELESNRFRNTSVCLCGRLSTFTSYKKHRQNEAAWKEKKKKKETAHLHSPCAHLLELPCYSTDKSRMRYKTDTLNLNSTGFRRPMMLKQSFAYSGKNLTGKCDYNVEEIPLGPA